MNYPVDCQTNYLTPLACLVEQLAQKTAQITLKFD